MIRVLEKQFEKIAEEAVRKAECIQCSLEDFSEGLSTIVDMFKERLDLVKDELRVKEST